MLKMLMNILFWSLVTAKNSLVIAYRASVYGIRSAFGCLNYWFHVFVWSKTPWWQAYARAAWKKYTETPLYRDRLVEFGGEYAFSTYFGEGPSKGDLPHFKRKVREDRALMIKIILAPFSVNVV